MRGRKYVELASVLAIFFSSLALFGLGCFTAAFIYRLTQFKGDRTDLLNVYSNPINIITIVCFFCLFVFLMILLIRQIERLNHPETVMVTLEYVDEFGNKIQEVVEMEIPKTTKKDPGDRFQKLALLDKQYL